MTRLDELVDAILADMHPDDVRVNIQSYLKERDRHVFHVLHHNRDKYDGLIASHTSLFRRKACMFDREEVES